MRRLIATLCAALMAASPAWAIEQAPGAYTPGAPWIGRFVGLRLPPGGPGACPYTAALAQDGCQQANTNAMFLLTNTATLAGMPTGLGGTLQSVGNQSAVSWIGPHPPGFNLVGVDYPGGPDRTKAAALKDPKTDPPAGCTFYDTGNASDLNSKGGAELNCTASTPIVIDGYEFGPIGGHLCTWLRPSPAVKNWTVTNNHFVNDDNCPDNMIQGSVGETGSTVVISDNLFDGKFAGYTAANNYTITTTSQTVALPNADKWVRLMHVGSGGTVYFKYGTSAAQTCGTTAGTNDGNFSDLTGGSNGESTGLRGSNTYVCLVTSSGTASVTVAMSNSPNLWWSPVSVQATTGCNLTVVLNVFINVPGDLGGLNMTNCTVAVKNNLAYNFNAAATGHSAWFAMTMSAGTVGSPSVIQDLNYSYNVSIQPASALPGSGSTTFSNLMQGAFQQANNVEIVGNVAIINTPNSTLAGFTGIHTGSQAALYYASQGRITGTLTLQNNWVDPQGAVSCYTTDGITSTTNGLSGASISGTTLTVTSVSPGSRYLYPGEILAGTGLTTATILSQLTDSTGGTTPYTTGTYQLDTDEGTPAYSSNWRAYNTPMATLAEANNFNLTTGNAFTIRPAGDTNFNRSQNWAGGACENHG